MSVPPDKLSPLRQMPNQPPLAQHPQQMQPVTGGPQNVIQPDQVAENAGLWNKFLEKMATDKDFQQGLLTFGTSLLQPREAGQTQMGAIGKGLQAGAARMEGLQDRRLKRNILERQTAAEEVRAGAAARQAETSAAAQVAQAEQAKANTEILRARLGLDEQQTRIQAQKLSMEYLDYQQRVKEWTEQNNMDERRFNQYQKQSNALIELYSAQRADMGQTPQERLAEFMVRQHMILNPNLSAENQASMRRDIVGQLAQPTDPARVALEVGQALFAADLAAMKDPDTASKLTKLINDAVGGATTIDTIFSDPRYNAPDTGFRFFQNPPEAAAAAPAAAAAAATPGAAAPAAAPSPPPPSTGGDVNRIIGTKTDPNNGQTTPITWAQLTTMAQRKGITPEALLEQLRQEPGFNVQ